MDLAASMDTSAGEADIPSSSNAPSPSGLESQPKMETDAVPSSSGASKNDLFKLGILFALYLEMTFACGFPVFHTIWMFGFPFVSSGFISTNMICAGDRVKFNGSVGGMYTAASSSR